MRLVMVGLDYETAAVEVREAFSPPPGEQPALLRRLLGDDVDGCALLTTCNRTELYISYQTDIPPDGVAILCEALRLDPASTRRYFVERHERQAVAHLLAVAGGLRSSVLGDDQIITQVRTAVDIARQAETTTPLLEALFRAAVTAGKKVKTLTRLSREASSVAGQAVLAIEKHFGGVAGRHCLVIGNGAIGHLAAELLSAKGCRVAVTLRKHSQSRRTVPDGCDMVDFDDRYTAMRECDFVVAATSSPEHVVTLSGLEKVTPHPSLLVDLAIPRDIDPAMDALPGVTLWNIDALHQAKNGGIDAGQLARAEAIIEDEAGKFDLWRRNYRRRTRLAAGIPDFPVFINLRGATVLVVGGGKVAARRSEKLLAFGASVRVVAPDIGPEMEKLQERLGLEWLREAYQPQHLAGVTLAIAATDRREVNRCVGLDARSRGVLVSVADRHQECSFYFPAILQSDCLTAGLISSNGDHLMVKQAAARLRQEMEAIDEEYKGGEPREPAGDHSGALGHRLDRAASS